MDQNQVKIIAEIGINHNGSLDLVKKLIDVASFSGCDFVKFQKMHLVISSAGFVSAADRLNLGISRIAQYSSVHTPGVVEVEY